MTYNNDSQFHSSHSTHFLRVGPARRITVLALSLFIMHSSLAAEPPLGMDLIANGFSSPVLVTHAPDDSNRIFVVEQVGRIRQVDLNTLTVSVFLDITSRVITGGERGLLGLAFHPDYQSNGQFYVHYTGAGVPFGRTVISRFNVSANPEIADASSEFVILTVNQPESNHNGGMIAFGPNDGFLYIGMGDGGGAGDLHGPNGNSQDTLNLLGKMLRIDVDGGSPYAIPASNPFTAPGGFPDEVWAYGLRNPWRWSFDRLTGDMYIGDVGQNLWEEIDFEPASSPGGVNWGWRLKEATHCFNPSVNCDPGGITTDPILEYRNDVNTCSVTGGYVYRGCDIAALQGAYFYADFCTGEVWTIRYDGVSVTDTTLHFNLGLVSSFGEDAQGEIYICDFIGGAVSKVVPVGPPDVCNAPPDTFFLDIDMQAIPAPEPPSGEQALPVDELQGVVILCSVPITGEYFLRLMAVKDASGGPSGLVVEALIPPGPCNLPVSVMSSVHFMPGNMLVLNHDLAVRNIAVSFSGENGTPSLGQWQDFPFLAKPADVGEATDLAEIPGAEFDDGQPRLYISTDKGMILMIGRDITGAIMLEDTLTPLNGSPISSMAPIPQQTYLALGAWADGVLMGIHPCWMPRTPQFSFVHPNLTAEADFAVFEASAGQVQPPYAIVIANTLNSSLDIVDIPPDASELGKPMVIRSPGLGQDFFTSSPVSKVATGSLLMLTQDSSQVFFSSDFTDSTGLTGCVVEVSNGSNGECFACCDLAGDANNSDNVNIADVTYLIARIFAGGQAPICCEEGDVNGSGKVNIADVTYLIARIFAAGPAPVCGPAGMGC